MTRLEALEYVARYKLVNEIEIAELRSMSIEVKLEQTNKRPDDCREPDGMDPVAC